MFVNNLFWDVIKEVYPLFLWACAVLGVKRMAEGVWNQLRGEENTIADAMNDVIVGFFFAHITLAFVGLIWVIMKTVGVGAEEVVERAFNQMDSGGSSTTIFKNVK